MDKHTRKHAPSCFSEVYILQYTAYNCTILELVECAWYIRALFSNSIAIYMRYNALIGKITYIL